jgi:hypothetical protein
VPSKKRQTDGTGGEMRMIDQEKVIKGLEICTADIPIENGIHKDDMCQKCPYHNKKYAHCFEKNKLMQDALALLKEQEAAYQGAEELLRQTTILFSDAIKRLKEYESVEPIKQIEEQKTEWEHLWDAPDGTFKGRCKKCGFVHFFIEGRDGQYKFCPECGRAVKWNE